jgi:phosphohistidine phosphatase
MNIYLIRHGEAETISPGKHDSERVLTEKGVKMVQLSSGFWKNFIAGFDFIIASPLIRAVQTAEIIKTTFESKTEIIKDKALLNGSQTKDIIELIELLNCDNAALIGHQPDISYHLSNLITEKQIEFKFKPAMIAKVSFSGRISAGKGILEFLIPPIEQ